MNELTQLQDKLSNMDAILGIVGDAIMENVDATFDLAQDPWGQDWHELSEVTKERRRKGPYKRDNLDILKDNGHLATSFSQQVTGNTLAVGSIDQRAGTHQFGAKKGQYGYAGFLGARPIPWGDIPARPMLPIKDEQVILPEDVEIEIRENLKRYFNQP